jgi:hypothetical protein
MPGYRVPPRGPVVNPRIDENRRRSTGIDELWSISVDFRRSSSINEGDARQTMPA